MELLQKHFDTALESPGGIKKLRELILTLAMQGKLVKQDPKDQPASELLEEIQAEKERLIKEGKIKKQKELPVIKPEEVPYAVPSGWEWTRLGVFLQFINGDRGKNYPSKDKLTTTGIPFISAVNLSNGTVPTENLLCVNDEQYKKLGSGKLEKDDIVFCIRGSLGKSAIYPFAKGAIASSLVILRQYSINTGSLKFLYQYISSPFLFSEIYKYDNGTAQPNLSANNFMNFLFPLPPLSEQKRIVAKIDELMALCDKLEAQRNARNDKRLAVHTAAINRLLTAADKNDFDSSWQFITRHFDPLYSVKENVAELKKAILTLAMQGKLVKQDPKDQPASELLKEIQAEKKNLASREGANARRKEKELPPIKPEEVPYQVPKGWVWVRLGEVGETNIGLTYSPTNISEKGIPVLRSSNVQNGRLDFNDIVRVQMDVKESALVKEGDLLICARNGSKALVGKTAMITGLNEPMAFGAFMAIFRSRINKYILRFINSPLFRRMIDEVNTMTINQITQENLKNTAFPLPPLAEQKRIVAKIDELMALCDRLESQIDQATAKQTALFDAVLAQV
jgi:type I restriction enzyme S subunit